MNPRHKKKDIIICRCNEVSKDTILAAIESGCKTMNEIYDKTNAGVGPCGGSCRKVIAPLLENHLKKTSSTKKDNTES